MPHQRPANKIPHEVDLVLGVGGCHVGLLQVGLHSFVEGERLEQVSMFDYSVGPVCRRRRWQRLLQQIVGEFLAGGCIWVHIARIMCGLKIEEGAKEVETWESVRIVLIPCHDLPVLPSHNDVQTYELQMADVTCGVTLWR